MNQVKPVQGNQSIFAKDGSRLYWGRWNPQTMFNLLTLDDQQWSGKRVIDIASNTSSLSIEIARRGASVLALEPDPFNDTLARVRNLVDDIIRDESLQLDLVREEVYDAKKFGPFDVIICFGLVYHLRYPQHLLDFLSSIGTDYLFVSTHIHPGDTLTMHNRCDPAVMPPGFVPEDKILTGWHPTRPLFERMLQLAGFMDVISLTEKEYAFPDKLKGLTNSSYFGARQATKIDLESVQREYYPR